MSDIPLPDDPLTRAEAALRQAPVPDGPPDETIARTLAALRAAVGPEKKPLKRRKRMRLAIGVSAAVLAAVGGLFYLGGALPVGAPLAFAEVAQKLRDAHTLAYQTTVQAPGMKDPMTVQVFLKEPGWVRIESPGGQVTIGQTEQDKYKVLTLDPTTKTARLMEGKQPKRQLGLGMTDSVQLAEQLRRLVEKEGQPVGKKQIGNVQSQGFRVKEGQQEWLIWADPATRLPVRVEVAMPQDLHATYSDFRFNPKLDDTLFRLEVPEGYKLLPMEIDVVPPEEALVLLLRFYAETSGGNFPKRLDDPVALGQHFGEVRGKQAKEKLGPEDHRSLLNMTNALVFVTTLKGGYGYKPDGAKLGDADKIIFWYRPAGTTKYRALYGNLHWADVTTDQLPEIPKPQP